jgi:formiminoglutamase
MDEAKKLRFNDSLASSIRDEDSGNTHSLLCSSSDIGVRRNMGRNGSRFAPKSIIAQLKKMQKKTDDLSLSITEISDQSLEKKNFDDAQRLEAEKIKTNISHQDLIIHLGGGHDHAYPMLKALDSLKTSKIYILNVDAHCDTRVDDIKHSGTPFRDFANSHKNEFKLIQYGIHAYANSPSTISELKGGEMELHYYKDLIKKTDNFTKTIELIKNTVTENDILYFSLDADALHSSYMEGVSAVNHQGLPLDHVIELMNDIFSKVKAAKKSF